MPEKKDSPPAEKSERIETQETARPVRRAKAQATLEVQPDPGLKRL